jgi:hypothetical protein
VARAASQGGGLLGSDQHVGQVVFDCLEAADHPAELLARGDVFAGHLDTGPAGADGLGRRQDPPDRAGGAGSP